MAPLFVLSETSAGYVLFKSSDKKLLKRTDIADSLKTAQDAASVYVQILPAQFSYLVNTDNCPF